MIALVAPLLLACARPAQSIGEQAALTMAVKAAMTDSFHFSGALERPTNLKAELKSLGTAAVDLGAQGYGVAWDSAAIPVSRMVWVVTMDGAWPRNFPPRLPGEAQREPWHHLAVILDSDTGATITLAITDRN
jgi:hypothetical protein